MRQPYKNLAMEQFNILSIDQCNELIDWFKHQKKTGKTLSSKTKVIPDYVAPYSIPRYSNNGLAKLEEAYLPMDDILCKEQFDLVNDYAAIHGKRIKNMHGLIVTSYPVGGFIQWHVDRDGDSLFSTAIQLNTDYEGGELQFGIDDDGQKQNGERRHTRRRKIRLFRVCARLTFDRPALAWLQELHGRCDHHDW